MLSEKILFSKKQYGFFTTLADPPPPGLAKDHKKYGFFFRNPSLSINMNMSIIIDSSPVTTIATATSNINESNLLYDATPADLRQTA